MADGVTSGGLKAAITFKWIIRIGLIVLGVLMVINGIGIQIENLFSIEEIKGGFMGFVGRVQNKFNGDITEMLTQFMDYFKSGASTTEIMGQAVLTLNDLLKDIILFSCGVLAIISGILGKTNIIYLIFSCILVVMIGIYIYGEAVAGSFQKDTAATVVKLIKTFVYALSFIAGYFLLKIINKAKKSAEEA